MAALTEKEDKINDVLEFIGLNKNERLIYLDLIKNGSSTALEISRRAKIHRPNTYDALSKLIESGFVSETKTSLKHAFQAIAPEKLLDYLEQKKMEVESIIPMIKEFSRQETSTEDVMVTRGTFAIREALWDLMKLGKPILVYGAPKDATDIFGLGFIREFHRERMKRKVPMLHIYNDDARSRIIQLNKMKYTKARHLAREYDSRVTTIVCGEVVLLITFFNKVVITIKSKDVADSYQRYFELLWKRAK